MFQTATVTELRFKTKEIWKKSEKNPVWIFRKGKKGRMMIDAVRGEKLLQQEKRNSEPNKISPKTPSLLEHIKKYQMRGPKNLSTIIDSMYE